MRNSVSAINSRIQTRKVKKDDKATIQELEEIIYDLIDDKNELRQIAEDYKEKFVAQQISPEDIKYITGSIIPLLRELARQTSSDVNNTGNALSMEQSLDILESLLSVETFTVLQLLGFNFKQAIGEPLTLLLQKFIISKAPIDPQSNVEYNKIAAAVSLEVAKIAQDPEATERWERLKK